MSGHSKWHSIKHKKAIVDARRGKIFTRIIRELTIAARLGGSDVSSNPRLRTAVAAAKEVNMPGKNIDSAIKKGAGELDGAAYEEITYEGYGPGGVAILVETTTDNRNRTTGEVRHGFTKHGGTMGVAGSLSFLFNRKGMIVVPSAGVDEDKLLGVALDAGAEDLKTDDPEQFTVVTDVASMYAVRHAVEEAGFAISSAELTYIPTMTKAVDGADAVALVKTLNLLDDVDDVQNIHANFEMPDEFLDQLN
jgi:YebC/PmpR family DNA-binding regulatory protein